MRAQATTAHSVNNSQKLKLTTIASNANTYSIIYPPTPEQTPVCNRKRQLNTSCSDLSNPIRFRQSKRLDRPF